MGAAAVRCSIRWHWRGGLPTVPSLVLLLFTLPTSQHRALTHLGTIVTTQVFGVWTRLMSARCSSLADTGGLACAPFVIPEPTEPDTVPETQERHSTDMC